MDITKRIVLNGKAQTVVIKTCFDYKDLEDALIRIHNEKKLNFLPFKHFNIIKDFFDRCLSRSSVTAWDLEMSFLKWKKDNNLKASGLLELNYYLLRGYSKEEASCLIKQQQIKRSNTNKQQRILKTVKTKRENNSYSSNSQARGRNFYLNKGFTSSEVDAIIDNRNKKWLQSLQLALSKDPTINSRKGKTRQQLIEKYGPTKAYGILSSRLGGSISKPELLIKSLLSSDWDTQWFINFNSQFYVYDFINHKAKIIIEYNGDIWHANPSLYKENWINPVNKKTAKEIWNYDNRKKIAAEANGYKVVVLWEKDFMELRYNNEAVINKLYELTQGNV